MEKGFNDQELADIMNEIENLEKEFAEESPAANAAPEAQVEEEESVEIDHTEPEVLGKLAEQPLEVSVPKPQHSEKVVAMKNSAKKSEPQPEAHNPSPISMNFQVNGEMTMQLGFQINDQSIFLSVSEKGLVIEMESGGTFTLPLAPSKASKKAA